MFIFVLGESGSGKSLYAEKRLSDSHCAEKIYIATAKVSDNDPEMSKRIELHKARRRDKNFTTIERDHDLGSLKIPRDSCVLIEALTTWLANEIFFYGGRGDNLYDDFKKLKAQSANIILVSDYIFSDGIIYDDFTENYVKKLAELTIKFASEADEVIECFAGLIYNYKPEQKNE